ncbi:palmitoyltransferase erf2 [Trichoderma arundinaceum]|uniref:Palmitoyltransferase n=1 Tax=Trichoderma arundinaceum TaxID=490622 RepID=A0A395NWJ1_TRIAR|nr:palmitoyltransferase erf2 [Trichoderma arundinaceum]
MASPRPDEPVAPSGEDQANSAPGTSGPEGQRPASVVSSHMTDIASEDEGDGNASISAPKTHRTKGSGSVARPETARTAASSKVWGGARKNLGGVGKRGSGTSTTSSALGRSPSLTSRSHVPSLTSNAFFHPMSSQKLQAQRGGAARPLVTTQPPPAPQPELRFGDFPDNATDIDGSVIHDFAPVANHVAPVQHVMYTEDHRHLPSRGTDITEHDTFDQGTDATSPTGHYAAGSMSESVRPLRKASVQEKTPPRLDLSGGKSLRDLRSFPSPMLKTPRSFGSTFLTGMGGDRDQSQSGQSRNAAGVEKLASTAASSPRLNPVDSQLRPKTESTAAPRKYSRNRNYEYFEGNTMFLFGGRWQNTRQRPINVATGLFVVIPCVLFFVFEAPWLWHNISPAIPIIFAYLAYLCFSSFLHASISDPGILPRNLHQFPPLGPHEDPLRVDPPTNDWTLIKSAEPTAAAMEFPVKHCRTCNIWRPPRAHHCRLCDNCVETHDHHCVWLNNCVGKRNYRYFFTFVSSATILSLYLIGASLAQLIVYMNQENISFGKSVNHFRVALALVILGVFTFLYPAALMGYHIFLMARGETTREFMNSHKFTKSERYRPFDQASFWRNILAVLCRPRTPSYYQFKKKYENGDQRLGIHRDYRPRLDSRGLEMDAVKPSSQGGFQGPVALHGSSQGEP